MLALARRLLVNQDRSLAYKADEYRIANPDKTWDDAVIAVIKDREDLHKGIAALAALIGVAYRENIESINALV